MHAPATVNFWISLCLATRQETTPAVCLPSMTVPCANVTAQLRLNIYCDDEWNVFDEARIPRRRHRHRLRLARHADILATILAMMSVSMSVSWNASFTQQYSAVIHGRNVLTCSYRNLCQRIWYTTKTFSEINIVTCVTKASSSARYEVHAL